MIDTIRFAASGVAELDDEPIISSGPRGSYWRGEMDGLRVGGQVSPAGDLEATSVEVSLQKLLGLPGHVLGPDMHQESLERLSELSAARGVRLSHVTRLDACGQLNVGELGGCGHVIRQLAREPMAHGRRQADLYAQGEGVMWRGSKKVHRAYDKGREMTGKQGDVLRLEVQIRNSKAIREACPRLEYGEVFRLWRAEWNRLPSISPKIRPATWADLVAVCEAAGFEVCGQSVLEMAVANKSERQKKAFIRAVRSSAPQPLRDSRLSDFFPVEPPASWPCVA